MSTRITSLPDLALLEVFASLPLTDLFTHVPLVCRNWARLQPESLHRRKHLYLVPRDSIRLRQFDGRFEIAEPLLDHKKTYQRSIPMDWCLSPMGEEDGLSTDLANNCLLLPDHKRSTTTRHMKALSSVRAVKRLIESMPHLTELTFAISNEQAYYANIMASVLSYLARLVSHYSPQLTVLRVLIYSSRTINSKSMGQLLSAINTCHRLHSLQIHLPWHVQSEVRLSRALLCKLRFLALTDWESERNNPWLSELATTTITNSNAAEGQQPLHLLHPELTIVCQPKKDNSVPRYLLEPSVSGHVRMLSLNHDRWDELHLCQQHFRALTALQVGQTSFRVNNRDAPASVHQVLIKLATAQLLELTCLSVVGLPISTVDSIDLIADLPVLDSVRRLTITTDMSSDHSDVVYELRSALHRCFPALERLTLKCTAFEASPSTCCCESAQDLDFNNRMALKRVSHPRVQLVEFNQSRFVRTAGSESRYDFVPA